MKSIRQSSIFTSDEVSFVKSAQRLDFAVFCLLRATYKRNDRGVTLRWNGAELRAEWVVNVPFVRACWRRGFTV